MEFDNHDVIHEWRIERKMKNELWLVFVTAIGLTITLNYMAPAKAEPVKLSPKVAQELGWCDGKGK